ncbi:MAG: 30S ribosomal protein S4 [Bacteroidetes bacterium]|nr:30S ribosomal protein S4 [Bacteroidota bacterium]
MARYRGSATKIARKFGEAIFGYDKAFEKKNYTPGQHGNTRRRRQTQSEYAIQLKEKQKAKYTYGLLERQFANLFEKASRKKGNTGENLLKLLEARLDNTVYRLSLAPTRRAARQLVSHKHVTVNGRSVNIPSYTLKDGDIIGLREKSKALEVVNEALANRETGFNWLEWDVQEKKGVFSKMIDFFAEE